MAKGWASASRGRKIAIILPVIVVLLALGAWIVPILLHPKYPTPEAITARMQQQAALTGGAQVYATHCAYCHDTGFGPSIAGQSLSVETVHSIVRLGPAAMQAFTQTQVSDADIAAVALYLNGLPTRTEKSN